jgi:tmRNA-binding protein
VPLKLYFNDRGIAPSSSIATATGRKKLHDKRETVEEARLGPPESQAASAIEG